MSLDDLRKKLRDRRRRPTIDGIADDAGAAAETAPEPGIEVDYAAAVATAREARRRLPPMPASSTAVTERFLALRAASPALAARLDDLDPWQVAAVLEEAKNILLRAQVGSGKTTVLVARVLALLALEEALPERLVVMTFTNKAAAEIRDRIARAAAEDGFEAAGLRIGTFHGLCRALLRRSLDEEASGRSRRFGLLDPRGRLEILKELVAREKLRIAYAAKLDRRLELLGRGEARFGNMKSDDDIARLAEVFEAEKRARDLMDFDDLIAFGRVTARALPEVERPAFIVVDEFQDSDPEQLALLEDWRGPETGLFAVGDPDQVIYSWRGGSASLFDDFASRFDGRELHLVRNYRSSSTILEAARFVLGPLAGSHELQAAREQGADLTIRRHHDPVAEARHLADVIAGEAPGRSVGILVRTREQMEPIREQLEAAGIELMIRESRGADDPLRDWLTAYLDWLEGGASGRGAATLLGDGRFGFPGLAGRKLGGAADGEFEELLAAWLPEQEADRRFLIELVVRARRALAEDFAEPPELLAALGLEHFLAPRSSRFEARRRRALDLCSRALAAPGLSWSEGLRDALVLGERGAERDETAPVQLMTMHAAKGLEFDRVFISGANRGMISLASSFGDPEQEAEERRLLFVAMTRARDDLEIGWFGKPPRAAAQPEPSPWIALIPERLVRDDKVEPAEGEAEAVSPFGAGQTVRHPRYGDGVVIAVEGGQVRCLFGAQGEKSFSLAMCPLVIAD